MSEQRVQRRLAAILAADVVGYSRLMGVDEEGTLARLKALRAELFDPTTKKNGGRIVKTTGDGTLVEFPSAVDAVRNAVEIQRSLAKQHDHEPIQLRIGINVGDVIVEGDDIYGDGVNVAARLETLAEPGGICISGTVFDQIGKKLDLAIDDLGPQSVKNIAEPVRTYRVHIDVVTSTTEDDMDVLALPNKPSIAILAFENMSGDLEQEYFSDGIAEDIITDLSKISGLFVIARNSSFAYKGQSPDMRRVRRELGVRYVLEGSVRKAGDQVRINAQLIDTQTSGHLWAERYDGHLGNIFALQDEITAKIVSALEVSLTAGERARAEIVPTKNMDAYDLFLRGRAAIFPPSREGLVRARRLLEEAIEHDPAFAEAHALLGYVYFSDWAFMWADEPTIKGALDVARKGVQFNESSALAHQRLGWLCCAAGRHEEAVNELERAIVLDPNDADSFHWLGETLNYMGEPEKALVQTKRAMRLSPHLHGAHHGHSNYLLRHYEDAIVTMNEGKARAPEFPVNYIYLAIVYSETGCVQEAKSEISTVLKIVPSLTQQVIRERWVSYRHKVHRDRFFEGLRKAGLPE